MRRLLWNTGRNSSIGLYIAAIFLLVGDTNGFEISFRALGGKRVLVVGGSGRVGGSVVTQLIRHGIEHVTVAGSNKRNFEKSQQRWIQLFPQYQHRLIDSVAFQTVDRQQTETVQNVITQAQLKTQPFDLVIHTAGPFQGKADSPNGVLQACVDSGIPYIDVCDDYYTAQTAQTLYSSKVTSPCILATGCWPGVSSLMAKQLAKATLNAYPNLTPQELSVDFGFFTAGSGGAGVTLLVATFLILAEKALFMQKGQRRFVKAMRDYTSLDFGSVVGHRDIAPLNLLETASIHDNLEIGSTSSGFGTAPDFWNTLLSWMAMLPSSLLGNEKWMRRLSQFSMPIVRLVDSFAGATNAMRVDVTCVEKHPDLKVSAIYAHHNLESCVGECVTAFACALLTPGAVPVGVWFPEQAIQSGADTAAVLHLASIGACTTDVAANGLKLTCEQVWGVVRTARTVETIQYKD